MSVLERLPRALKLWLAAAMIATASLTVAPAASAAPAPQVAAAVQVVDDVGTNAAFDCYYWYTINEFYTECYVYSGYVAAYGVCEGIAYYTPYYTAPGFWAYLYCGSCWLTEFGYFWVD